MNSKKCWYRLRNLEFRTQTFFLNMDPDAPKINADPKSYYGTVPTNQ
jgi:hypothetical protein